MRQRTEVDNDGHAPIRVEVDDEGSIWIEQGSDMIEVMPVAIDDLIKALQSAKEQKS